MITMDAGQWTRFSRPVAKWHVCSLRFGAQCRFIREANQASRPLETKAAYLLRRTLRSAEDWLALRDSKSA